MKKTQEIISRGAQDKQAFEERLAHLERLSVRAMTAGKWIIFAVFLIGCVALVASYSRMKKTEAQLEKAKATQDSLAHRHAY